MTVVPIRGGITKPEQVIALLDEARALLARAHTYHETKAVVDRATMLQAAARQSGCADDIRRTAAELKLSADRRAGEVLGEMLTNGERRGRHNAGGIRSTSSVRGNLEPPTFAELGIDRQYARKVARLAEIPAAVFNDYLANGIGPDLSRDGAMKHAGLPPLNQPTGKGKPQAAPKGAPIRPVRTRKRHVNDELDVLAASLAGLTAAVDSLPLAELADVPRADAERCAKAIGTAITSLARVKRALAKRGSASNG
jgi:hypothetical protein